MAFIGAQSALLFGYAAWGGIKELTAAPLLALGVALVARLLGRPDAGPRASIPLAVAGAALTVTLGPGAAVYALPALAVLLGTLAWRSWRAPRHLQAAVLQAGAAVGLTALLALPMWLTIAKYTSVDSGSYSSSADTATRLGNLAGPLRALQIAGVWLTGDFRDVPSPPPSFANHLLIWIVIVAAVGGVAFALVRRTFPRSRSTSLVALVGALVLWVGGSTPWLIGKAIAISSPAVLVAGLAGGAVLLARRHVVRVDRRASCCSARSPAACCGRTTSSTTTSRSRRARAWPSCRRSARWSAATGRRSSTSTRSTATATSCAPARRSSPPSTATARRPADARQRTS